MIALMEDKVLKYSRPALEWVEGIPLGNGTIGAMLFGKPGKERLTLNHDRLFRKKDVKNIQTAHLIPKMRELISQGFNEQADQYLLDHMGDHVGITNPFQVFCEMEFDAAFHSEPQDYQRSLDMSQGIAQISFRVGGSKYFYEYFVSQPDQALFISIRSENIETSSGGSIDADLRLTRVADPECTLCVRSTGNTIILTGDFIEGVGFASLAEVVCSGATITFRDDGLSIRGADTILVRQVFSTTYTFPNPLEDCIRRRELGEGFGNSFEQAYRCYEISKGKHIEENKRLFDRVDFQLDGAHTDAFADESFDRLGEGRSMGKELYTRLFHMGRYCLLSSSRPGSYPMNLQGIWNDRFDPLFESGYTTDMNIQMQYWAALATNLSECELPVFRWLLDSQEMLSRQARAILGTGGYYVPQYTDIHFTPASQSPYAMFQLLWIGAAAWLGQHFHEYWKYTCDDRFARECAYPYLKKCAETFKDWLVKDENGTYRSIPSYSPENTTKSGAWSVNTSTMDITIIRELIAHLRQMDEALGLNDPDRMWWDDIEKHLPEYPFDEEGNLKEWTDDIDVMDPRHRHISHIYGIFPGKLFSPTRDERIYEAAVKAIYKRREGGFTHYAVWSHAWFACCFARIGCGDQALESINYLMKGGMCSNFLTLLNDWRDQGYTGVFTTYKLLQIEALLGATAAITEMLIQSFDDEIRILPSLPDEWSGGKVTGLRGYGGLEFSVFWKDHRIEKILLKSMRGGECTLRFGRPFAQEARVYEACGRQICLVRGETLHLNVRAEQEYRIEAGR